MAASSSSAGEAVGSKRSRTVEETYKKMTPHEHIIHRPDMYIGTTERITEEQWVLDEATETMVLRKLSWVPGLYKIFDEILVNAADNKVRDPKNQTWIQVDINVNEGRVRVWNNGEGIPIQKHAEHKMWIPEMIFGHLLTSSNYDDSEAKVTGGRNGFGAKLTNVFSKRFEVETVHRKSKKKFMMRWNANMLQNEPPTISDITSSDEDYTMVTFWPDFAKFGMRGFEEDIVLLMKRRVYDVAGCTDKTLRCKLNGRTLPITTFPEYVDLYPTMGEEKKAASYARVNDRWEVCIRMSNIGFQHVSFVNCIATMRGGNHVKYIADQVISEVTTVITKKHKGTNVKPHMIKPYIWVFINCLIENPSFDSQTKETLNSVRAKFGSDCPLPAKLIDYVLKSGIVERAVATANSKLTKEMEVNAGKTGRQSRITGIPKLEDANDAGTKNSADCTLILTEGDSAKALAVSGFGTVGRDRFGVFPLRGKLLNVRDVTMQKVLACEEIQNIVKIMGLKVGTQYTNVEGLRYGHLMIMSDQDHDGSHIKGLVINFIHHFWPSLVRVPGFVQQFITPIVKAFPNATLKRGGQATRSFFSLPDFLEWRKSLGDQQKNYTFKYYKGLGTSTSLEGREYFSAINDHRMNFVYNGTPDDEHIVMAFGKDKVEDRKRWITSFNIDTSPLVDYRVKRISYADFVDKELILFSIADCERSIPSVIDGFKPGQRKIIFSCFKRNLTKTIKVAQLAGYVSEHSAYHHGEQSLTATIVGLAQDYVGANNVPLLVPDGQFGTRLQGGKDHASARYIFTNLDPVTRSLFQKSDDNILDYKDDDGFPVEPHFYIPVIPMVLVNGTSGIGTGFATSIPNYNPFDIIKNLRRLITGEDCAPMVPWYYGFTGTIEEREKGKFVSKAKYRLSDDGVLTITDLPINSWTGAYKKFLEDLQEKDVVLQFRENHTDVSVDFDVYLHPTVREAWVRAGTLEEKMGLRDLIHATNIICFNRHGTLTKYADAESVIKEFYIVRLEYYGKRKEYLIADMTSKVNKLRNMARFVSEVTNGQFIVNKKKKADLLRELREKGYVAFPPQSKKKVSALTVEQDEAPQELDDSDPLAALQMPPESADVEAATKDYDYLLSMRLWNLTLEMVQRLQTQLAETENQLRILQAKTLQQLWIEDLDSLQATLTSYFQRRDKENAETLRKRKPKRPLDASRIRAPLVSEKLQAVINKSADKVVKVAKPKAEGGDGDGGDLAPSADTTTAPKEGKPKPPPKRKPRKKKKSSDDEGEWDFSDDTSDDDDEPPSIGSDSDADKDEKPAGKRKAPAKVKAEEDEKPKPKRAPRKPKKSSDDDDAAPVAKSRRTEKSAAPSAAKKAAAAAVNVDDDEFDLDSFGLDAAVKQSQPTSTAPAVTKKAASPPRPKLAARPAAASLVDDDDDDDLLFGATKTVSKTPAAPKPKPAAKSSSPAKKKTAAPKKKKASSDDDYDDETSSSEFNSSTSSSSSPSEESDSDYNSSDSD